MIRVHRRTAIISLVVLVAALAGGTALAATQGFPGFSAGASNPDAATPIVIQGQPAGVGTPETTEEGLTVTLAQIVKQGTRWLFHFQIKNTASTALIVRGTSDEHQFVIAGVIQAPPYNKVVQLESPAASEQAASYSDLAAFLQAGGTAQGWLAVDTANLGFTPSQILYRYRAVPALGCTDPTVQSTCHTDTLYAALQWFLP